VPKVVVVVAAAAAVDLLIFDTNQFPTFLRGRRPRLGFPATNAYARTANRAFLALRPSVARTRNEFLLRRARLK